MPRTQPRKVESPSGARETVYEKRGYTIRSSKMAQRIAAGVVGTWCLDDRVFYGLPEVDDRYHIWRVPLLGPDASSRVGELVIDAMSGVVDPSKSSVLDTVRDRIGQMPPVDAEADGDSTPPRRPVVIPTELRNTILCGRSEEMLAEIPEESVQLMFTSPPYFNARPDYRDYQAYEAYLNEIGAVMSAVHRVLEPGRFAVVNSSPVLLRRAKRSEASRRIGVPFDIHQIMISNGFEFIDDIIWLKPEGAGWATGRGRRFAADRNPLQYKAVPVTEYVMVYRKTSNRLIDWHIRNHRDPEAVKRSKIEDGYERTNVWRITPASSKLHPAVFPKELAEKVIRYYSFEGDSVLDPYAGIGTVGAAASGLKRKFVLGEANPEYVDHIREAAKRWLGTSARNVNCVGCSPISTDDLLC